MFVSGCEINISPFVIGANRPLLVRDRPLLQLILIYPLFQAPREGLK